MPGGRRWVELKEVCEVIMRKFPAGRTRNIHGERVR